MVSPPRHPRGQQRDKMYREALRLELAGRAENMLAALRKVAAVHIDKAEAGDMLAIKELRDTLDGKPVQQPEQDTSDGTPITRIVHEIVHLGPAPVTIEKDDDVIPQLEWHGNGKDGAN
jgi:hypothetical protein